jgi:phosphocarrier protein HPr
MNDGADGAEPELRRLATIRNRRGLHARAAARFVKLAWEYDAEVTVAKNGTEVSGRSIMGLMMLAAGPGTEIELRASGPQAAVALDALATLIDGGFDED